MKKRIKAVVQLESLQCGAACVATVCRYYGQNFSMSDLSRLIPIDREGVSAQNISRLANNLGFSTTIGISSIEEIKKASHPIILHWEGNHFVVFLYSKGDKFIIADPAYGKLTIDSAEFRLAWCNGYDGVENVGLVIDLVPTRAFPTIRPSKPQSAFVIIGNLLKAHRSRLIRILSCVLVATLLQSLFPYLTRIIVDDGIKNNNIGIVWLVLLGEVFIVFGKTTAEFARRRIVLFFSFEVSYNLVCDFLRKLLRLEIGFFDVVLIGDLNQRISDYGRVQRFLTDDSTNIIMSVFSLIIFSAILVSYSPVVFVLFLFPTILSSLGTVFLLRRRKRLDFLLFKANSYSQIETYRFLSNMQEIKLQGCENRRCRDWQEKQQQVFDIQKRMLRLQQIQELIVVVSDEIKSILITLALAFSVLSGNLSMGSMLAIQIVVGQLNVPTRQIISFVYSLQDLFMSLARINEIMTKVDEDANKIEECALTGGENIRIEDVEFSYSNRLGNVLNKISIIIPNKKVTAIVGPSGCGKTTLIKMLLGYYRPKRGSIMLGETPLTDINLREWRGRCGVVMQDGVIFSESIERNIANTDERIDNARLLMAAKMVNADCFISELPLGYKTKIGDDGVDLSKGQKQRLLLARVIYKDPKYIFLDEATNSLDVINEQQIVANMRNFFKDKTVVIAAHRLSTIRNADQIVVINNGAVAEVGNHKTLMAKRGAYYNLINQQI